MFGIGVGIRVGGRTPVGGSAYDADAQAFFDRVTTAGGTLTTTEKNATNQLVLDMKSAGIWTSMKAVYPMVGASAAACAQNLKSSSFTGTFSSGWTFASTGVTPNGTSAYMTTGFVPSANLSATSQSSSFYSRTNSVFGATLNVDFSGVSAAGNFTIMACLNSGGINFFNRYGNAGDVRNTSAQRYDGFFVGSRTSATMHKGWRSNVLLGTDTNSRSGISTVAPTLGAENDGATRLFFCTHEYAFAHIGDGLTDTQASDFYTAVQAFQTTLARNV